MAVRYDSGGAQASEDRNLYITVTNSTNLSTTLDIFHFDARDTYPNGPRVIELYYQGGDLLVTDNTLINSAVIASELMPDQSNWRDFDWSLSGLPDTDLGIGESAQFRLRVTSPGNNPTQSMGVDNIGISGDTVIPESTCMTLIGLAGCLLGWRRYRRC